MNVIEVYLPPPLELRKRRKKAQEKGDGTEEAKLCNALGEIYIQKGQ